MVKLVEDLATLTTIPAKQLEKLVAKSALCISDVVAEAALGQEDKAEIDLGIGQLKIKKEASGIRYVFIPSTNLAASVNKAFSEQKSSLVETIDTTLVDRVTNTYKDLI